MKNKLQITCIVCPLSCCIDVEEKDGGHVAGGYECSRGEKYALQETLDPRRVLTGTVRVAGGRLPRLPVKTTAPIPKGLIPEAARLLDNISVEAPLRCGELIVKNFAGSGAGLVATRDLEAGGQKPENDVKR
ncbi:MAG TPA: DUF1667 domain-containing protein [Bacillota bacterium]|nr:DUF1667 domain-containing protein [Bacillota bacterium]HOJ83211.1 DUF1667 domain-containing protein [Bacillota bacterium]HOL14695.1 DUF1667 domain-containing protein [Bacillota bacterium]HPZ11106.1 DUF1667 domain-containing protein [Bacillota bacterium]HQE09181.1 DUF1667 domain-containing protein [Bacillota bacterium]